MRKLYLILLLAVFSGSLFSQYVKFNSGEPGLTANILQSKSTSTVIEYTFNGYAKENLTINGVTCVGFEAPGMIHIMEKDNPELLTYRNSIIIPDMAGMNYRIISDETEEISTNTVMPSKGHMTRDIDIDKVPYVFGNMYKQDAWYPANNVMLDEPYIVRDLRGMTIQINPMQYNSAKQMLRIHKKIKIEVYPDANKIAVNPFYRVFPLKYVDGEYYSIYKDLFMNFGTDENRYDSIPEPGRMLVIYASQYASTITAFTNWKVQRGFTVLTAEYPTATGSGATNVKAYIQSKYNETAKVTYIILIGEAAEIPYLSGVYEGAASDPCYVKLAGTDAYPDAFISRFSPLSTSNLSYMITKTIKYERDIQVGAPWYKKGIGIASNENGGTAYYDWQRANMLRDTLMSHSWTQVDQVYDPGATSSAVTTSLNDGRSILNYIGHGSGTSWSTSGFNVSNANALANGWKNPVVLDVSCLNGQFTLSECLAEAFLRAGDTNNPKGAVTMYSASTNTSWVPPCDWQTHSVYLLSHGYRKSSGGVFFSGVMKAMDLWGGSTGEGLKLMEQYHIFGDCSLSLTWGVPLGPMIAHTPLGNTENVNGPYVVNCVITPLNSPINPAMTKVFWTRGSAFTDSVQMTNSSGNNWTANIPGNGVQNTYKYYIRTADQLGRLATSPGGAPGNYYSFQAAPDLVKPVIVHTTLGNVPKTQWPATVSASVTDNIGIDSVWVRWYINTPNDNTNLIRQFKLLHTTGDNYAAAFNSTQADVNYNDIIYYKIFARDNSSNHNVDSTTLRNFTIVNIVNTCWGTGTTAVGYPFYTYYMDARTDMLYTAAEVGTGPTSLTKIGFTVVAASSQVMNGFKIKLQNTTLTTISGFTSSGWTEVLSTNYTIPGTGLQMITFTTPFTYTGGNLLVEICFNNSSYTSNTTVNSTSNASRVYYNYQDISAGDGCTAITTGTTQPATLPNVCFEGTMVGVGNIQTELPKEFKLSQNYPNPFNPVTTIKYSVPKQSIVKLVIYDIIGRVVGTLANEMKQPGNYEVQFDASNLASGAYFYRIEAGDFVDVKKMVLVK
jgi:hypothetical protein